MRLRRGRALHDALPLLQRAQVVTVIGVGDEVEQGQLEAVAGSSEAARRDSRRQPYPGVSWLHGR